MNKKIEVFLRQCYYSRTHELPDRIRPEWFSKSKAFDNFKKTIDPRLANYTIVYDEYFGKIENTFLSQEEGVKIINCGNECDSFLQTLEIIKNCNFSNGTVVYFLEDDYLHRPNWCNILFEGFTIPRTDYVTLYDFNMFINIGCYSEIFTSKSTHWRAIPGTTNTFATTYKTLMEDYETHKKYSTYIKQGNNEHQFSRDRDKFLELSENGRRIISPIPGYSTHCVTHRIAPCINWEEYSSLTETEVLSKSKNIFYS